MEHRKIKFRVFDKTRKEMFYLAESQMSEINLLMNNNFWGLFNGKKRLCGNADNTGVLMQFTGLTDTTGKEVYEGDIHKTEPVEVDGGMIAGHLPIVFDKGAFWLDQSFSKNGSYLTILCEHDEPLNIAGNIYEQF